MNKKTLGIILIIAMVFSTGYFVDRAKSEENQKKFVGAGKCKMCHSSDKKGAQYKSWEASKHSKAYQNLGTAEAKAAGAKVGVTDPQNDPKCLKCHVTAYGVDAKFLDKKYAKEEGVSCESCHGAGEMYVDKKAMEGISQGTTKPESVGLIIPTEELCKKCHNAESPTFTGFNFEEMHKKIAHPMPADYKSEKGYK
jgi:hypothetical protein